VLFRSKEAYAPEGPYQVHDSGLGGVVLHDHLGAVTRLHLRDAGYGGQGRSHALPRLLGLHAANGDDRPVGTRPVHALVPLVPAEPSLRPKATTSRWTKPARVNAVRPTSSTVGTSALRRYTPAPYALLT